MNGKRRIASLAVAGFCTFGLTSLSASADQTTPVRGLHDNSPTLVALQNATIITEPGEQLQNATLVIEQGRVTAVNRNNRAPDGARIVDASGYTIYPGFVDAYSNYGVPAPEATPNRGRSEAPQYNNAREGGNASNDAIHAQVRWVDHVTNQQDATGRYVEQGFTTVQSARLDGIFQGRSTTLSLADKVANDIVYRSSGRQFGSFDKGSSQQQYPSSLMGSIALIRQTLEDARWYRDAQGKVTLTGEPVEYNAALAALTNIANDGVVFDVDNEQDLIRAYQVFNEFEVPVTFVGSGFEYARLADVRDTNAQLILPVNFPAAPEVAEQFSELDVSVADLRHWERAPGNPAMVANAGIDFALTLHGLEKPADFWPNLRTAVDHGLSRDRALAALTTVPAAMAGVSDKVGKLAPGYMADFVVSRGDLFTDGEIVSVWLQGKERELKPMHSTDFAGDYDVRINEQAFELSLSKRGSNLQGTLSQGDTSIELQHVRQEEHRLQFVADLTEFDLPGIFRISLAHESLQQFIGTATDGNGSEQAIVAVRDVPVEDEATATRQAGTPEYVGRLTYPNVGFGVSELPEQQNLHIRGATVWTADDQGTLENADILVRNGVIQAVGTELSTPRGYQVIDAQGMHVTPGIIDEHSHIAISRGVNEGTEAVTSEVRIGDVVNADDIHIYRSLAGGTTIAHLLHGSANPIGGQGQAIKLRWGENADGLKFAETPPTIKMALGENVKQSNWGALYTERYPQTRMGVAAIMHDYFRTAREYEQAQQAYSRLSRAERNRTAAPRRNYQMEALLEILNNERFTHVHSYVASEVLALLDVADDLDFNIHTFTHILEGYKVAEEMAEHGARASSFADWWAYKMEAYDAIPQNACVMMEKGVLTSINSDSNDLQRRLNTEAAKSVRYCDMSEHEALRMVTYYPAQQLEIDEYVGSITEGKHADLVLWNEHPLSAYAQVQQTWIEGRKYFDRAMDLQYRETVRAEHQQLVQKVLSQGASARQGASNGYKAQQPSWHCEDQHDVWWGVFDANHQQSHTHGGQH